MYNIYYTILLLITIFFAFINAQVSNVRYSQQLPATNGVRYGCSKPMENRQLFKDCETEGGDEEKIGGMSRAVCDCVSINRKLHLTCYKDKNWYPSILGACSGETEGSTKGIATRITNKNTSTSIKTSIATLIITAILLKTI